MKAKIKPRIDLENRTKLETVIPLSVPFIIFVDPSDLCNFRCKFCPSGNIELMKKVGRSLKTMDFKLYKKIIDDVCEFERPIKVLRLYKDGEPLLNPRFAEMVRYAKEKKCSERIDTTTNGSLLNPKRNLEIIEAGLDRINISIEGVSENQYLEFSNYKINFEKLVRNIRHFYENRKNCEVIIKINGDTISDDDKKKFYEIFGDIADGVYIEHIMSCWPEFEIKGVEVNKEFGIYGQKIKEVQVCPYVFYSFSINSDGSASACFLDWSRKLIIGDAKSETVKDIWDGEKLLNYQKMFLIKKRKEHPICGDCGQMSHGLPDDIDAYAEELLDKLMKKNEKNETLTFNPYTSITMLSLQKEDEFLQDILSSKIELFPRRIDKPVILYGAGSLGKMAKDFFNYSSIPFLYVVDKNANQYEIDEYWQNIKVVHPDDVKETDKKNCLLVVCIVTVPLIGLQDELKNNGWKDIALFYDVSESCCDRHPLSNGWFLGKFSEKEKESIKKVFSSLADDISRAYYVQFLAWRKLRIELLFDGLEVNKDNRFFIPEITGALQESEVFVDCGAHKGFVTEKFLRTVNNKYKEIYAIEPDYANFKILETQTRNIPNITTIKCALSDKNGEERFYQGFDFASKLDKLGKDNVKIATLDSLNIPATFIKVHLEGGELNALKGAVNTIQKYRPIIAVTIYHNPDGVWEIPLFLISNAKNYKYYMRLHSWGGTGAVFYAIPEEKIRED